jgi:hypothetical protein
MRRMSSSHVSKDTWKGDRGRAIGASYGSKTDREPVRSLLHFPDIGTDSPSDHRKGLLRHLPALNAALTIQNRNYFPRAERTV